MFSNLKDVLDKKGISTKQYALVLGIAEKSAYNKITGATEFTLSEAQKTATLLNEYSMEYLFREDKG